MTIKKIVGVISCKGGVGKSTLAVNLAVLLSSFYNKRVGLLDADIHGPNHPRMLGLLNDANIDIEDKVLLPKRRFNVASMSMGYFLKPDASVLLRGPMVSNLASYLFKHTDWGDLDILIVDFPPGTGDIHLSMLRDIKFDGVFLITIPQLVSIEDVQRSIDMLKKFNIKIFGLLENMKFYKCNTCKSVNYIYGNTGDIKQIIDGFAFLNIYELPLHSFIGESSNVGVPFVISNLHPDVTSVIKRMALKLL